VDKTRLISKSLLKKKFSSIKSPQKPEWIKVKYPNKNILSTKSTIDNYNLVTVCEEALCPNIAECWSKKHATFMLLGDVCTRSCSFCNIQTGNPKQIDKLEPVKIAKAVKNLNLNHVVITSVDRDDLSDGGAFHFVNTINLIKTLSPNVTIEILTPDFKNKKNSINIITKADFNVFNHNLETVKDFYKEIRPGANYNYSLSILKSVKDNKPNIFTKSGFMIGLGETLNQINELMDDLLEAKVDFITIGQYLRPSINHYPVIKYHKHNIFNYLKKTAIQKGFKAVSSSPFARSSYKNEEEYRLIDSKLSQ
jgi:lipoic acid synthetase